MRAVPAVVVGLLASVGAFSALSLPAIPVDAHAPPTLDVPIGRVGDNLTYDRFDRASERGPWRPVRSDDIAVQGIVDTVDETGASVAAVAVVWRQPDNQVPQTTAIDLGSRSVARRDSFRENPVPYREIQVGAPETADLYFGASDFGPALDPAWTGFADPSLFWFQGSSLRLGDDLTDRHRPAFADLWGLDPADGFSLESRVSDAGMIDGEPAMEVRMRGAASFPEVTSSPLAGAWNGTIPFLTATLAPGTRVEFTRTLWFTGSTPYPVLVEDRVLTAAGPAFHVLLSLREVQGGHTAIPWRDPGAADAARRDAVSAESGHPRAGTPAPACWPLDAALRQVEEDPEFLDVQRWRAAHTPNFLLGISATCLETHTQWELVFAAPDGRGLAAIVRTRAQTAAAGDRAIDRTENPAAPLATPAFDPAELPRAFVTFAHL